MNVDQLIKEIGVQQRMKDVDLNDVPAATRPGVEGLKYQAEENLKELTKQYNDALKAGAIIVILQGTPEQQAEYADLAAHEAETMTMDCARLYKNMANKLFPMCDAKGLFPVLLIPEIVEALKAEVKDCGIRSVPMFNYRTDRWFKSEAEMVPVLRDAIRDTSDDDINKLYLELHLVKEALEQKYAGNAVGVCLVGATESEAANLSKSLCAGNNVIVTIPNNQPINSEYVINSLKNVHKTIKSKKRN